MAGGGSNRSSPLVALAGELGGRAARSGGIAAPVQNLPHWVRASANAHAGFP